MTLSRTLDRPKETEVPWRGFDEERGCQAISEKEILEGSGIYKESTQR